MVALALSIAYALVVPAMAQAERGAISSLTLPSSEPGNWSSPGKPLTRNPRTTGSAGPRPGLDFLSHKDSNEAERGNVYAAAYATTLTLNDLTPGENHRVQLRARYYNADRSVHEWGGPWTPVATTRVRAHQPYHGKKHGLGGIHHPDNLN